jgi:hypothetical protein
MQKHKSELIGDGGGPTGSRCKTSNLSEADKMKELIKKTIKSASKYNSELQREKKEERKSYFDLQTMVK